MGVVYLLCEYGSNPERYKVGITKNSVVNRIKSLQTGSSHEIILLKEFNSKHYKRIESILHNLYKEYSTDGGTEWFELPTNIVMNFIQDCIKVENIIKTLTSSGNPYII